MRTYAFRLLNVFATPGMRFSGNPLCVFEDARDLDDATMLNLAAQFNLAETTFILPAETAQARVRIFTPGYEMPFAGHPALGTAEVVRDLLGTGDSLTLAFKAGVVPLHAQAHTWTFKAPCPQGIRTAAVALDPLDIARLIGLAPSDLAGEPLWVDTGVSQLLVPLKHIEAVQRAKIDVSQLARWPANNLGRRTLYLFAFDAVREPHAPQSAQARYFFVQASGGVSEDAVTGSACANLGGWLWHTGHPPAHVCVKQGAQINRPSQLSLALTADGEIQVGGRVSEIGRGVVTL